MLAPAIAATIILQTLTQAQPEAPQHAAQPEPAVVASETWGNSEVVNYLLTYGPDKTVDEDPFVAAAPPPLPARVVLSFPIGTQEGSPTRYWSYDRVARTMTITASEDPIAASSWAPFPGGSINDSLFIRGWALTERRGPQETRYVKKRSTPVALDVYLLTGFGEAMRITNRGIGDPPPRTFQHTFAIEPEAARLLANELELRVIGRPHPWRAEERTLCVRYDLNAIIDQWVTRSCYLTGSLETYQVVDKRDGSIIHDWDARDLPSESATRGSRKSPQ